MTWKSTVATALGATGLALAAAAPTGARPADSFGRVQVSTSSHGGIRATLGYHCFPNAAGTDGSCANAAYPLKTYGHLTIRHHSRIVIRTGAPAITVEVRLSRISHGKERPIARFKDDAKALSKTMRSWEYRVPRKGSLRGVRILGVSVVYDGREALGDFEVGARAK